jgi:hypothetical protein
MNKNSYSKVLFDHLIYPPLVTKDFEWRPGEKVFTSIDGDVEITQKKEKNMDHYKEYPFSINWESYKTLAEATIAARKMVMNSKEDVVIKQNVAIVKFPVPDYEVETLSV